MSDWLSSHGGGASTSPPPSLTDRWDDVITARADLSVQRCDPRHDSGTATRVALVRALESYLALIAARGYPAPYALVNELQMQRRICRSGP